MMNSKKKKREIGNITYKNKNIGFSITIPDNWMEVKKTSYQDLGINNNTLFIFAVDKFTSLTAVFSGFGKTRSFNKFFENFSCDDNFKILYKGENNTNKTSFKQLIVEHNNKKIMHNFCLINGMIVNFTINVDVKNKIFDQKDLINDANVKLVNEILTTIKTFEPVNPPIYIEEEKTPEKVVEQPIVEEKPTIIPTKKIVKKLSQLMVEKDCKYKNILVPKFYFNYLYTLNNSSVKLSVINNEIYFTGLDDCFRIIKVNSDLAKEIETIISENWSELSEMNIENDKDLSDSTILIKLNDTYSLIDLSNKDNNMDLLRTIFKQIISKIKKVTDTNFDDYLLFPISEEENKRFQEFLNSEDEQIQKEKEKATYLTFINEYEKQNQTEKEEEPVKKFIQEYDDKSKKEEQVMFQQFLIEYEEKLRKNKEDEKFRQFLEDYDKALKKEKENMKFREFLVFEDTKRKKELEYILQKNSQKQDTRLHIYKVKENNKEQEENIDFIKDEEEHSPIETVIFDQEEIKEEPKKVEIESKSEIESKIETENKNENNDIEKVKYEQKDLENLQEYLHNVDGHASFKFLFPKDTGEKLIRDFNVFDIIKDEDLVYRIFLFKCRDVEKYENKIETWMNKNVESSNTSIIDKYTSVTESNLEIKTYILANDKFYKIAYVYGYLIAISGISEKERLLQADIALDTVEIGEDSRSYVEACDRKIRSINTLRAQGIPYIDELPPIASSYEIIGKNLEEIAKRAIVLCVVCNFASDIINLKKRRDLKDSKKFFIKLLDTYNVRDVMTQDEKLLFEKMDKDLAIQISWQFEGYNILLWTLGLIEEVEFPDILVEPDSITSIVSICDTYQEFIGKCGLRNVHDVLDLADLTYRYNWYCVECQINGEEPIMNPEVVMERHRALSWLLSNEDWDKVEIKT